MSKVKKFQREARYYVLKGQDIVNARASGVITGAQQAAFNTLGESVEAHRAVRGKPPLEAVVVEKDWPEYEPVWALLECRIRISEGEEVDPQIVRDWAEARRALDRLVRRMNGEFGDTGLYDAVTAAFLNDPVNASVLAAVKEREHHHQRESSEGPHS